MKQYRLKTTYYNDSACTGTSYQITHRNKLIAEVYCGDYSTVYGDKWRVFITNPNTTDKECCKRLDNSPMYDTEQEAITEAVKLINKYFPSIFRR